MYLLHFVAIDGQLISIASYAAFFPWIPVWNAESSTFVVNESIEGYLTFRTEIRERRIVMAQDGSSAKTVGTMYITRDIGNRATILAVSRVTPLQCFEVKIGYVTKDPVYQKVCLYISDKTFDLSFGKRVTGLT